MGKHSDQTVQRFLSLKYSRYLNFCDLTFSTKIISSKNCSVFLLFVFFQFFSENFNNIFFFTCLMIPGFLVQLVFKNIVFGSVIEKRYLDL